MDKSVTLADDAQNKSFSAKIIVIGEAADDEETPIYKDTELNGADPVLTSSLVPVIIEDNGVVKKASIKSEWYNYSEKEWANAVVLIDKTKEYDIGETIPEANIESYFVWIPKYAYKIWDLGLYYGVINKKPEESTAKEIEIRFGLTDTNDENDGECTNSQESGGGENCHVGDWMTHPAFSAFNASGLWVAKFETTGSIDNLQSKPNQESLRNQTVSAMWNAAYNYIPNSDSHMMKNTEWGAVAYLSHSKYGINTEININNNSNYLTGYSAAEETDQSVKPGVFGTTTDKTLPYNTSTGYKASTTGNITGIYDMSGGSWEYVAAYKYGNYEASEFASDPADMIGFAKYFNVYNTSSNTLLYYYRILGDATSEVGPYYKYNDNDKIARYHNNWYADESYFVYASMPWFCRGGLYQDGVLTGVFNFSHDVGASSNNYSFRLILTDHTRS